MKLATTVSEGRIFLSTGNPWETRFGYSRGVRVGDRIIITGTLGINEDQGVSPDPADQARRCLEIIFASVVALGGSPGDLVLVRGFTCTVEAIEAVGVVFREMIVDRYGVHPCLTQVVVKELAHPTALVEVEAEAVVADRGGQS